MIKLSNQDLAHFGENGFLKLPQLSNPEELEKMRRIYDELFQSDDTGKFDLAAQESDKPKLPQILDPSKLRPELRETEAWKNAGIILAQLLGQEPTWRGDHAILKPANYGAPTPWHQDEAYWDPAFDHFSLSIWLPLQDVDEKSGCMHFIPGSHLAEVLPHRPIGDDPKVHGLELAPLPCFSGNGGGVGGGGSGDRNPKTENPVAVPLLAGEATVHGGRTLHYTPANTTNEPRRAYIMVAGIPGKPLDAPRRFEWQERQRAAGAPAS